MDSQQIDLIRSTFATAKERSPALVADFYERLFEQNPRFRHMFPADISPLQGKMVDALVKMVEHVDNPSVLATLLIPLGRRHGPYGIKPEYLPPTLNALAETIATACGDDWTQDARDAWQEAFDAVAGMFLTGLAHAAAASDDTPKIIMHAQLAAATFESYTQEQVDRICEAVYRAAFDNRVRLAEMAVAETGMGRVESKIMKNVLASQYVWDDIKDLRTVGVLGRREGITEIAKPMGVVLAVIPVTNPTSTAIYKILSSLKSRNSIVITGASRAAGSTNETARICYEAALAAGAPVDVIQWVEQPRREFTAHLMGQPDVAIILATGGEGLVTSAYSSGTPAFGVGAGNVPVYVHDSVQDLGRVAESIIESKTFDNGTICASEQALVCTEATRDALVHELRIRGGHVLDEDGTRRLERVAVNDQGTMNAQIVGKPASYIAQQAGIAAPDGVTLLIAPQKEVGPVAPLSQEILAPVIALYVEPNHAAALATCVAVNRYGGNGHTVCIYSDDDAAVTQFGEMMNAGRVLVNVPTSAGAVGMCTMLTPSLTLGCGTGGGNITTANLSARDLLNIQRIAPPAARAGAHGPAEAQLMDPAFTSADALALRASAAIPAPRSAGKQTEPAGLGPRPPA
jgi:acetaldehyde dehydrogenase (acetylating)